MKRLRYALSVISHWLFGVLIAKNRVEADEFLLRIENDQPQMS